jgi:hypothetical protein
MKTGKKAATKPANTLNSEEPSYVWINTSKPTTSKPTNVLSSDTITEAAQIYNQVTSASDYRQYIKKIENEKSKVSKKYIKGQEILNYKKDETVICIKKQSNFTLKKDYKIIKEEPSLQFENRVCFYIKNDKNKKVLVDSNSFKTLDYLSQKKQNAKQNKIKKAEKKTYESGFSFLYEGDGESIEKAIEEAISSHQTASSFKTSISSSVEGEIQAATVGEVTTKSADSLWFNDDSEGFDESRRYSK